MPGSWCRAAFVCALATAWSCATPAPQPRTTDSRTSRDSDARANRENERAAREALANARTPQARRDAAQSGVEEALAKGRPLEAARWLTEAQRLERDEAERARLTARLEELVDRRLSPLELRELFEGMEEGHPAYEAVSFKLAVVLLHLGDRAGASERFAAHQGRFPAGRFVERVARHQDRLAAMTKVEPTKIGLLLPLSGSRAAYGRLARQAVELAFQGSSVRIVTADTQDDEAETAKQVQRLVLEERVIAMLGPVFRGESRSAAAEAERLETPLLTISAADDVANYGPWVFRNGVTTKAEAAALVRHAMEVMGLTRFAILHPRHPYGEELRDLFWDEVQARGGLIRGLEAYPSGSTTFTRPVKRLVARDNPERREDHQAALRACRDEPDSTRQARCRDRARKELRPIIDFEGLFIPDYAPTIRMIAAALAAEDIIVETDPRQLRIIEKTLGRKPDVVTLLGASGWNSPAIVDSTGRTVENAVFTDGFFSAADDELTARFVSAYKERFNRVPSLYPEALMYDSARILRSVLQNQRPQDRGSFREALRQVNGFPGVTGLTSFAGRTDAQKQLRFLTIQRGQISEVPKPAP